jgi:hypothetical protein
MIIREEKEFYYAPDLMQNHGETVLLAVLTEPGEVTDLESHENAIIDRLEALIAESEANGDNVGDLIENYLHTPALGDTPRALALFVFNSPAYQRVIGLLSDRWRDREESKGLVRQMTPDISEEQARKVIFADDEQAGEEAAKRAYREYQQADLWDYLEQLSMILDQED